MLVILKRDEEDISRQAAQLIASAVHKKPALALGLATGSTMVGVYKQLVRLHKQGSLDFSRVVTFNLDEYLGLSAAHPQSFHYFMQENLFAHINVDPRNVHIPDGTIRGNYDQYCASYEDAIRKTGGIDLQLLGIGRNGHIGFNEPTSSIGSRTRLKVLSRETMDDNSKFFAPDEESPRCAIVDDESHIGMELKCGSGDRGSDGAFDGLRDGSGLGLARSEQKNFSRFQDRADTHGDGTTRTLLTRREEF